MGSAEEQDLKLDPSQSAGIAASLSDAMTKATHTIEVGVSGFRDKVNSIKNLDSREAWSIVFAQGRCQAKVMDKATGIVNSASDADSALTTSVSPGIQARFDAAKVKLDQCTKVKQMCGKGPCTNHLRPPGLLNVFSV